jgi:hypothetical protein
MNEWLATKTSSSTTTKNRYASSGVIFFNYTKPTLKLVEEWIRHVNFGTNVASADDKQLDEVFNARWVSVGCTALHRRFLPHGNLCDPASSYDDDDDYYYY